MVLINYKSVSWGEREGGGGRGRERITLKFFVPAAYQKVIPIFLYYDKDSQQFHPQHFFYLCNASISGDAHLEWKTGNVSIPFLYSDEFTSKSNITQSVLEEICQRDSSNKVFSIRFESSLLSYESGAKYLNEEIALVVCSSQHPASVTRYTCFSSDNDVPGPYVLIAATPTTSNQVIVIAVPVITFVVVLLVVIVTVLVVVYLRYTRLKAEPPRMCPIDGHSSVTASLIAATLSPYIFDSTESSHLEFPRENLEFVKVLG